MLTVSESSPSDKRFSVVSGRDFCYPLLNFFKTLASDYIGSVSKVHEHHGPLVHWRFFRGWANFVFISDADVNRELFVRHGDALEKSPSQIQTFLYAAGESVATAHGADWRKKRKEANRLFSRKIIEATCEGQVDVVSRFVNALEPTPQDAVSVARMLAALTSSRGILGRDVTMAEAQAQIAFSRAAGDRFNSESGQVFARPNWMLAPWRRTLAKRKKEAFAIVQSSIEDRRNSDRANDGLMAHYVNGDFVTSSDAEMQTILVGLLMGAQDNISAAVAWMIAFVAQDNQLQEQLRQEIRGVGTGAEDLQSCQLLWATVSEVLRLRPPAPANQPRRLRRGIHIAGHDVPKGAFIFNSFYNMHRDPDVFPDPEIFDPSRFLDTSLRGSPNFVPFGHGPRNCVAQGMAMQQLAAILVGLLGNHQVVMPDPHMPEVVQKPFLTPAPFDVEITQV